MHQAAEMMTELLASTAAAPTKDNRRAIRVRMKVPVFMHTDEGSIRFLTRDISLFGLGMSGQHSLRIDQTVGVTLCLPGGARIKVSARVVWVERESFGLNFVQMSALHRLSLGEALLNNMPWWQSMWF